MLITYTLVYLCSVDIVIWCLTVSVGSGCVWFLQLQGGGDMGSLRNFNAYSVRQGFIVDDVRKQQSFDIILSLENLNNILFDIILSLENLNNILNEHISILYTWWFLPHVFFYLFHMKIISPCLKFTKPWLCYVQEW